MTTGPRIAITYCTQCQWLLRAGWMAQELLQTFGPDIGEVALVPGTGGTFTITCDGETIWKPQTTTPVDEDRAQSILRLINTLEDDDDVQNVYANFEVDEETMAKLSAA